MENLLLNVKQNIKIEKDILDSVCEFINFIMPEFHEDDTEGCIKEVCVAKLCNVVGIRGFYNYKSEFFNFFASIVGEALMQILGYKIHLAGEQLRFFSFDHVNLVESTKIFLLKNDMEEAFIDIFNLVDKYKYLIPTLKEGLKK